MKKFAIITGGSKGIGLSIVQKYLESDYDVLVISRSRPNLDVKYNASLSHLKFDFCSEDYFVIKSYLDSINRKIDVLVNNAGFSEWKSIQNINIEFLNRIFHVNVYSMFLVSQIAIRFMSAGSSIINISSLAGKRGSTNNSAYVASKFATNGFTQALAKELGYKNIRVNGICPVLIPTPGLLDALNQSDSPSGDKNPEIFMDEFFKNNAALPYRPDGSMIADICLFLSSEQSKVITGQNINADCGVFPQ